MIKNRNSTIYSVVVLNRSHKWILQNIKKKVWSNFLNNKEEILNQIIEVSNIDENNEDFRNRTRQGALTNLLVERAKKLTCVEIDKDLEVVLERSFQKKTTPL